jgi:hypothetical protein
LERKEPRIEDAAEPREQGASMNRKTASIGAVLIVVAVVSLIVLSGGESDNEEPIVDKAPSGKTDGGETGKADEAPSGKTTPAERQVPTIVVDESGEPVGGVAELAFDKGDRIRFKVRSAVADHVHVHGYDLMKDVEPGRTVSFDFPADLEGIYEAELEDLGEQIAELQINP